MAMPKHRRDQHSIFLSIRRADPRCLLRALLQLRPLLVLVLRVRPSIHLQKRIRMRLSPRSPSVVSGKHLLLASHLVKSQRVRRRLPLPPLPSNLHSRLLVSPPYHHSRLVQHPLLRLRLANLRRFLRLLVPRHLIGPPRSPSGHLPRRSQQLIRSHLGQAVNLLLLLLATLPFRLELPEAHLHSVPGQMRLPNLPLALVHRPLRRRRREDRCLRWGLHHPLRKEWVPGE